MGVRPALMRALPLAMAVLGLGWLALRTHQTGHDWGDDFALYIRQAQSLLGGDPAQVVDDNRFALAASSWHTFSPEAYPWGWPAMMAPLVAIVGVDYGALKLVVVGLWCVALVAWHHIVRRRAGAVTAWALLLALGVSWPMVTWTNSVVSDIPYLACALVALWFIDVCRERGAWSSGSWWPLVLLGVLLALAFGVRREGLAIVAAVLTVNAVQAVLHRRSAMLTDDVPSRITLARVAVPPSVFLLCTVASQVLMPSVVAPRYPDTGLQNLTTNLSWYRDVLAQTLGLMRADDPRPVLLGSSGLALGVVTLVVGLAVLGAAARVATRPVTDLPLAVFAVAHTAVVLVAPFRESRYIFPVVPVIVYFAAVAPGSLADIARRSRTGRPQGRSVPWGAAPVALAALIGLPSLAATWEWGTRATDVRKSGAVQWGPAHPDAVELFTAVRSTTAESDVIAFFRARAMTMATDRRALQSTDVETIVANADWYAMERGSTYSQPLISDDEAIMRGFERVWSNQRFVLYRLEATSGT